MIDDDELDFNDDDEYFEVDYEDDNDEEEFVSFEEIASLWGLDTTDEDLNDEY